jgi:type I restriction enzyme S subunit
MKIPEIRFPEFSGEWVEKRLGDVCEIIMGQSPNS